MTTTSSPTPSPDERAAEGRAVDENGYLVHADPDSTDVVIVVGVSGRHWRIHREDADPEHRFVPYRLAAGWFGNLPADHTRTRQP